MKQDYFARHLGPDFRRIRTVPMGLHVASSMGQVGLVRTIGIDNFFLAISEAPQYCAQVTDESLVFVRARAFMEKSVSCAQVRVQQFGLAANDGPS